MDAIQREIVISGLPAGAQRLLRNLPEGGGAKKVCEKYEDGCGCPICSRRDFERWRQK